MKTYKLTAALAVSVVAAAALASSQGGKGKLNTHDVWITKETNAIVACPDFQGGVRVAVGTMNESMETMKKGWKDSSAKSFNFTLQMQTNLPQGRMVGANNLKQIGLAAKSSKTAIISFLEHGADGSVKETATYKVYDVTLKRGVVGARSGGDRPMESLSLNFTKVEMTGPMGSSSNGVLRTTTLANPESTNAILIGLLLPAVQKVR